MRQVKPSVTKTNGKQRIGQGFSLSELKKAEISVQVAARLKIPTDRNRKTEHERNVEIVKAFAVKAAETSKAKAEQKAESAKESKKKAKA
jgi:ribosomal protein L13E